MPIKEEMEHTPDLVHQARHFRTVLTGFSRNVDLLFEHHQPAPGVDLVAMATAFAKWRQAFDSTRHLADLNRVDFVIFSAGSLLKEMVTARPLASAPEKVSGLCEIGLACWPEGYAYASFCLSMASAVLQSMGERPALNEARVLDAAFWNSFHETSAENSSTAVGFFDLLCGLEPNWQGPDILWFRPSFRAINPQIAASGMA